MLPGAHGSHLHELRTRRRRSESGPPPRARAKHDGLEAERQRLIDEIRLAHRPAPTMVALAEPEPAHGMVGAASSDRRAADDGHGGTGTPAGPDAEHRAAAPVLSSVASETAIADAVAVAAVAAVDGCQSSRPGASRRGAGRCRCGHRPSPTQPSPTQPSPTQPSPTQPSRLHPSPFLRGRRRSRSHPSSHRGPRAAGSPCRCSCSSSVSHSWASRRSSSSCSRGTSRTSGCGH